MPRGDDRPGWVAVLGEAEGLRWVLENGRMAFTAASSSRAQRIDPGDGLILYVGRGAYHNPTRDESQLVAVTEVSGPVRDFRRPVEIAGREFVCGCDLRFEVTLPERAGVPVKSLVRRLSFVRRSEVRGQYFRSGLIEVPGDDFATMAGAVRRSAGRR